ncbi:MAG TPA: glycosyltransferase family 9 protein [Dyella sp.]|nr:glycosyltransferase family 9 protein [Dyella sp.]
MPMPIQPLVIRFGRLGDTLLLQPLLHRLHARYGQPCCLLATGLCAVELYRGQADVAQVMGLGPRHRPLPLNPEQWRAVYALRQMQHVPVYVCEPQQSSLKRIRLLLRLAGVPEGDCVFLNDIALKPDDHWIEHLLRLADATPPSFRERYGSVACETSAVPEFSVTFEERIECHEWLARRGLSGHPLVLLQAPNRRTMRWNGVREAGADDKSWPMQHWTQVVAAIEARLPEARILLCGSPAEHAYLEGIRSAVMRPHVQVVAKELSLSRLKVLSAIAHSMISVDTGPAHIAAAMGCPLVVMFGAVSPKHWRPRSRSSATVCVLRGPPASRRVDAIAPEKVIEAWHSLPTRDAATTVPGATSALV